MTRSSPVKSENLERGTVEGFGREWAAYDQSDLADAEARALFDDYFRIFPWQALPQDAAGFDAGCGSGRWARLVAPRVGRLHCIDASGEALAVARRNLAGATNCSFHEASVDAMPIDDGSMDFGYSLGVLHHVPDTAAALSDCVRKLKPGAPFLVYLYYAFDNRPAWFRALWRVSDLARRVVSSMPFGLRRMVTEGIAFLVYWPLARTARLAEVLGARVDTFPLSAYRDKSFYTMRTDALDRFGTRLEQRFTRAEITAMMAAAGLERITFSESVPHWSAAGFRRADALARRR